MPFFVAFHDAEVLEGARARSITGHFPHLRLVSLVPGVQVESLPAHLRATDARRHVRVETPFFTGPRVPVEQLVNALP